MSQEDYTQHYKLSLKTLQILPYNTVIALKRAIRAFQLSLCKVQSFTAPPKISAEDTTSKNRSNWTLTIYHVDDVVLKIRK